MRSSTRRLGALTVAVVACGHLCPVVVVAVKHASSALAEIAGVLWGPIAPQTALGTARQASSASAIAAGTARAVKWVAAPPSTSAPLALGRKVDRVLVCIKIANSRSTRPTCCSFSWPQTLHKHISFCSSRWQITVIPLEIPVDLPRATIALSFAPDASRLSRAEWGFGTPQKRPGAVDTDVLPLSSIVEWKVALTSATGS